MKKIVAMILCVILMLSVSVTAFAAGTTEAALTPSATEVKQGSEVTFSVAISNAEAYKSLGLSFTYNKDAFEWVSGEWKLADTLLSDVNAATAAAALKAAVATNGEVFSFVLKAKADAAITAQTVKVDYIIKNGSVEVAKNTATGSVAVACKEHAFTEWKVVAAATCTAEGNQERTCTTEGCGFVDKKTDKALGHKFGAYKVTKAATCTEKGVETATCSVCNDTTTKEIKAIGHNYGAYKITKAATCTEKGVKESKCANCGDVKTAEVALKAHDFEDPTLVKEATISTTGLMEGKCKNCSKTTTQVIPCSTEDTATGTKFEAEEGTFQQGTTLSVNKATDTEDAQTALNSVSGKFDLYNINAKLNGADAQPNGTVKATFTIPADFGKNVAVYLIADGKAEVVTSTVSEDGETITAELTKLGDYAVCDLDVKATEEKPADTDTPADTEPDTNDGEKDNGSALIIIIVLLVLLAIVIIIIIAKKKKK